jgi:hypothetical protein
LRARTGLSSQQCWSGSAIGIGAGLIAAKVGAMPAILNLHIPVKAS